MLPRSRLNAELPFFEDLADFQSNVAPEKARLIGVPITANIFTLALECPLSETRWGQLRSIAETLPGAVDAYLAQRAFADTLAEQSLHTLKSMTARYEDLITIKNLFYEHRLDEAFMGLTLLLEQKNHEPIFLIWLGKQLALQYREADKVDQALAALDLLARATDEASLPRDSLSLWYTVVDAARGPERFTRAVEKATGPVLISTGKRIELSGEYLDLTTGRPFEMASLQGKIVLFDFWYSSCGPCIAEIPDLIKFAEAYRDRDDFVFVSVCTDAVFFGAENKAEMVAFIKERGIDYITLYDQPENSLAERFEVRGYPAKFIRNAQGELMRRPFKDESISLKVAEAFLTNR